MRTNSTNLAVLTIKLTTKNLKKPFFNCLFIVYLWYISIFLTDKKVIADPIRLTFFGLSYFLAAASITCICIVEKLGRQCQYSL